MKMGRNNLPYMAFSGIPMMLLLCYIQDCSTAITRNILVRTPNYIYQAQLNKTAEEAKAKILEVSTLHTIENKTLLSMHDADENSIILHTQDTIFKISFNKTNATHETTLLIQLADIRQVSVDDLHKNLYFYEEYFQVIGIIPYTRYSSDNLFHVIINYVDDFIDMTFAPEEGFLFWITRKNYPVIHRSDSNGEHKTDIVFRGMLIPTNIEVNRYTKEIIWMDKGKQTIESVNFDGYNRKVIYQSHLEFKGLLPIDMDSVLTFNSSAVFLINNSVAYDVDMVVDGNITDITIQYKGIQKDACAQKECSQFCFKKNSKLVCECYDGNTLHTNGKDCLAPPGYIYQGIFIVLNGQICQFKLEVLTKNTNSFACWKGISNVTEITIDVIGKTLYYIQYNGDLFQLSKRILGFTSTEVLYSSSQELRGLAVDESHHIIYFGSKKLIKVFNVSATSNLLEDESNIVSVAVDSANGLITWITTTNHLIKIASLDGSNQRTLVVSLSINRLAISNINMRVFWTTCGGIMSVNESGGEVKVNIISYDILEEMYIYKNLLIWTTGSYQNSSKLCSASLDKQQKTPKCIDVYGDVNDISVYDESLKTGVRDECDANNNHCEDVCLSNTIAVCRCQAGRMLKDTFSCEPEIIQRMDSVLVDNNGNLVYGFGLNSTNLTLLMYADGPVRDVSFHEIDEVLFVIQNNSITTLSPGNNTLATFHLSEYNIQMACFDTPTNSIFFLHKSSQKYSLVQFLLETKLIVEQHSDIIYPSDILCASAKRYIIIAEKRVKLFLRKVSLSGNTTTTITTLLQTGDFRLASYPDDDHFYLVAKTSNQIFEFDYEGRSSLLHESFEGQIVDIDVDKTFIYVLIENNRFILQVKKSDGKLESRIQLSAYFGRIGMITTLKRDFLGTRVDDLSTHDSTAKNSEETPNSTDVLPIVLPIVLTIIVLTIIGFGIFGIVRYRRRNHSHKSFSTKSSIVFSNRERPLPAPRSQEQDSQSSTLEYSYTADDETIEGHIIERKVSIRAPTFDED